MPGVYLEYIKAGRFVVPVELTFQTETVNTPGDIRGLVSTSKWIERHNWKEIKAMLKPAVEACLKYNDTPLDNIPKSHHISYGREVSLGYLIIPNKVSAPFLNVLDATKNCWTDDEDDEDELLGISDSNRLQDNNPGPEFTEFVPTKTAIRVCVVRKSVVSIDDARRIRKELGVRSDDVRNYFSNSATHLAATEPGPSSASLALEKIPEVARDTYTQPPTEQDSISVRSDPSSDSEVENVPRTFGDPDEIRDATRIYPLLLTRDADSGDDPDDDLSLPDIDESPPKRKKGTRRTRKKSVSQSPTKGKRLTHSTSLALSSQEGETDEETGKKPPKKSKPKRTVAIVEPMRTLPNGKVSFEQAIGALGTDRRRKARPSSSHCTDKNHTVGGRSKVTPAIDIIPPDDDRLTITNNPEPIVVANPSTSTTSNPLVAATAAATMSSTSKDVEKEKESENEKRKQKKKEKRKEVNIDNVKLERQTPSPIFDDDLNPFTDSSSEVSDTTSTSSDSDDDDSSDIEMPVLTKMVYSDDDAEAEEVTDAPENLAKTVERVPTTNANISAVTTTGKIVAAATTGPIVGGNLNKESNTGDRNNKKDPTSSNPFRDSHNEIASRNNIQDKSDHNVRSSEQTQGKSSTTAVEVEKKKQKQYDALPTKLDLDKVGSATSKTPLLDAANEKLAPVNKKTNQVKNKDRLESQQNKLSAKPISAPSFSKQTPQPSTSTGADKNPERLAGKSATDLTKSFVLAFQNAQTNKEIRKANRRKAAAERRARARAEAGGDPSSSISRNKDALPSKVSISNKPPLVTKASLKYMTPVRKTSNSTPEVNKAKEESGTTSFLKSPSALDIQGNSITKSVPTINQISTSLSTPIADSIPTPRLVLVTAGDSPAKAASIPTTSTATSTPATPRLVLVTAGDSPDKTISSPVKSPVSKVKSPATSPVVEKNVIDSLRQKELHNPKSTKGANTMTRKETPIMNKVSTKKVKPKSKDKKKKRKNKPKADAGTQTDTQETASDSERHFSCDTPSIISSSRIKVSRSCEASSEDEMYDSMSHRSRTPGSFSDQNISSNSIHHPALGSPNRDLSDDDGLFSFDCPTVPQRISIPETPLRARSVSNESLHSAEEMREVMRESSLTNSHAISTSTEVPTMMAAPSQPGCSHWVVHSQRHRNLTPPRSLGLMPPPTARPPRTPMRSFDAKEDQLSPRRRKTSIGLDYPEYSDDIPRDEDELDELDVGAEAANTSLYSGKMFNILNKPNMLKETAGILKKVVRKEISAKQAAYQLKIGENGQRPTSSENKDAKALVPVVSTASSPGQRKRAVSPDICDLVAEKRQRVLVSKRQSRRESSDGQSKALVLRSSFAGNAGADNQIGVVRNVNSRMPYEPQGDEFDMSQSSYYMVDIIPRYPEKSRLYKMHSTAVRQTTISQLVGHFNAIRKDLFAIFHGKLHSTRHTIYISGSNAKQDLQELNVTIPFTGELGSTIVTLIYDNLFPDTSMQYDWMDYVNYVLRPEAFIRIYARINNVSYHLAETEMRFRACYYSPGEEDIN